MLVSAAEPVRNQLDWVLTSPAGEMYAELLAGVSVGGTSWAAIELVDAGFAVVDPVTGDLVPLPPEVPIVRAIAVATNEWLNQQPDFSTMGQAFLDMVDKDRHLARTSSRFVTEYATRQERMQAIHVAFSGARSQLDVMYRGGSPPDDHEDPQQEIFAPDTSSVTVRYLYEHSVIDDEDFRNAVLAEVATGVKARAVAKLPADAGIVDRSVLLVLNCDEVPTAIRITAPPVVESHTALFDLLWATGTPLGWTGSEGAAVLSEHHQLVLSQLIIGRPMDAIARSLKVDRRTINRRLNDLFQAYDVENLAALIIAATK